MIYFSLAAGIIDGGASIPCYIYISLGVQQARSTRDRRISS